MEEKKESLPKKAHKDISNQTVFILAILAILISLLSVATILSESTNNKIFVKKSDFGASDQNTVYGSVKLNIGSSSNDLESKSTTGSVSLNIVNDNLED